MEDDSELINTLLLSNFVHQIINPLNGVLGTIDNLVDGTISDENKKKQRLNAVRGQLSQSIEMIRNLAFLSQLQTKEGIESFKAKAEKIIVPGLIIDSIQFFQELADQNNIKIELVDSETQYCIKGHRNLLLQVFMNLLDNAVKYCDKESKICIKSRVQKKTNKLILEIENIGIGFDYEERDKIFMLGGRGQAAEKIKASGSGIGLHISRRIIELAHDGEIEAEHSKATRTTIIRIKLKLNSIAEKRLYGEREDFLDR